MPTPPPSRSRVRLALRIAVVLAALAAGAAFVLAPRAPGLRTWRPRGDSGSSLPALRVLFVGNSYTYVNDLPGRLGELVAATGTSAVAIDSITGGGATLAEHLANPEVAARIRGSRWTHVVLQGQSVEPLLEPAAFETAAVALAALARDGGAVPVLYETWARRAGDAVYAEAWSGGTPERMQAGLRAAYRRVAETSGARLALAGDAFERALAVAPGIALHSSDGSHPTLAGTSLVALVFLEALTGHGLEPPVSLAPGLADTDARALEQVAAEIGRAAR